MILLSLFFFNSLSSPVFAQSINLFDADSNGAIGENTKNILLTIGEFSDPVCEKAKITQRIKRGEETLWERFLEDTSCQATGGTPNGTYTFALQPPPTDLPKLGGEDRLEVCFEVVRRDGSLSFLSKCEEISLFSSWITASQKNEELTSSTPEVLSVALSLPSPEPVSVERLNPASWLKELIKRLLKFLFGQVVSGDIRMRIVSPLGTKEVIIGIEQEDNEKEVEEEVVVSGENEASPSAEEKEEKFGELLQSGAEEYTSPSASPEQSPTEPKSAFEIILERSKEASPSAEPEQIFEGPEVEGGGPTF